MSKEFKILHISDSHYRIELVQTLHQWILDHQEKLDTILFSGDIADMPMEYGFDTSDEAIEAKASSYSDLQAMIKAVGSIHENIYYIPGNHDCPEFFKPDSNITPPCNVHLRTLPLAPGLFLAGLGGSVPGYQNGKQYWKGFPYSTEEEIQKDLNKLLEPLVNAESSLSPTDQLILMTHNGPDRSCKEITMSILLIFLLSFSFPPLLLLSLLSSFSSLATTIDWTDPNGPIQSGSDSICQWLLKPEMQQKVLLNIHGHTHSGFGEAHVGNISILNPGPFVEGHFSIYTLLSDNVTGNMWTLSAVRRFKL